MTNHQATVPNAAKGYFVRLGIETRDGWVSEHPVVVSEFHPDRGWMHSPFRKRISASWARKLRARGITHVRLSCSGHEADFSTKELSR